jgi:hypothetical protein
MLFFSYRNNVLTQISSKSSPGDVSRWDWKSFNDAERVANDANAFDPENRYVAADSGANVSPRYDVVKAPKVGEPVSYGFNGDYYPCGNIVKVGTGPKMTVTTDTGEVFYRRGLSGSWIRKGGTWSLVRGIHSEKNPSF